MDGHRVTNQKADDEHPPRAARLTARIGTRVVAEVVLEPGKTLTLGSAPGSDMEVDDVTVSRKHLEAEARAGGVFVKDLGSTNGMRLFGARVKEAVVPLSSVLLIGDVELSVEAAEQKTRASLGELVSVSPPMLEVIQTLRKVAPGDATILLEAEAGSGKEVTARGVHGCSKRANGPFEMVDCGALPRELASSELFGHVKGALTGADPTRPGALERARGGTLFLDEIDALPFELQPLLLRALERREVWRVGDEAYRSIDVRVLAATSRNLDDEVTAGRFSADLLHRLAGVRVRLPPLRERPDDIPLLTRKILETTGRKSAGFAVSAQTLSSLQAHRWPGNVRELRNLIERALALSSEDGPMDAAVNDYRVARERALGAFERDFVVHLLRRFDKNMAKAAQEAGIDRVYLQRLIKKHNVPVDEL